MSQIEQPVEQSGIAELLKTVCFGKNGFILAKPA